MAGVKQGSDSPLFKRHVPEHALPEELASMPRDDTVCTFCGVSYLIHNEIKSLEEKLAATLAEMELFRGAVDREKRLIDDATYHSREMEKLRRDLTKKNEAISMLRNDVRVKDDSCARLQKSRAGLQEQLASSMQDMESTRSTNGALLEGLNSLKSDIAKPKALIQDLRSRVTEQGDQMRKEFSGLSTLVARLCSADSRELEAENTTLSNRTRSAHLQLQELRQQISDKSSEITRLQHQCSSEQNTTDSSIQRLKQDLELKDSELEKLVQELRTSKDQCDKSEQAIADLKQKSVSSTWQTAELAEQLEQVKNDCETLKSEREMMITSHQCQMEQLRESFKTRITDSDMWPQKLEEALRNEKKKHSAETQLLSNKLKKSFVGELEIEKQKHQKLLERYVSEYKDTDKKIKAELSTIRSRHKMEVSQIQQQLVEGKTRNREAENTLRAEINGLKKIIKDLEARIVNINSDGDALVASWKVKAGLLQRELEDLKESHERLEQELAKTNEDRAFLEETVRRECEERFQLMETLSETKEELLRLKRLPGGYPGGSRPGSASLSGSSSVSVAVTRIDAGPGARRSEQVALCTKFGSTAAPRVSSRGRGESADADGGGGATGGVEEERAKKAGKGRNGTLGDSRRRIAEAVGRM